MEIVRYSSESLAQEHESCMVGCPVRSYALLTADDGDKNEGDEIQNERPC